MPYNARVIEVLIASPSDVSTERAIARDEILEWNIVNSRRDETVLLPVGWETHASPEIGRTAQALINETVVDRCDILVAMFWKRIGTPTATAPSGTVEEIRRHVEHGKLAMVYFCKAEFDRRESDHLQREAVQHFKQEIQATALVWDYETHLDFRLFLKRHLAMKMNEKFPNAKQLVQQAEMPKLPSAPTPSILTKMGQVLLKLVSEDQNGALVTFSTFGGTTFQTNQQVLVSTKDGKTISSWESALHELLGSKFLRQVNDGIYRVTREGYDEVRRLQEIRFASVPPTP